MIYNCRTPGKAWLFLSFMVFIKRHSTQNSLLSLASSASLPATGAEKRIIHFYQTCETVSRISICHRLVNFVSHQPCCPVLFNLKKPLHLPDKNSHFVHGHTVNQPIPFRQRQIKYRFPPGHYMAGTMKRQF